MAEKFQQLIIKPDKIIEILRADPQVKSARFEDGKFIVETIFGDTTFKLIFKKEKKNIRA